MKYTTFFTKTGFETIQKEYNELLEKRPEFVHNLSVARDMGDRSENAAYKEARRKLSATDSRLRFLKRIVESAKIVIPKQTNYVELGSIVTILNDNQEIVYSIVGEHEADPVLKKLSYKSPVGRALLHRKVGEKITVDLPIGTQSYTILKIQISG